MTERGLKRKQTFMDKYNMTEEEYYQWQHDQASKGGKNSTGGFKNMTSEQRAEAGRKGGSVPRVKQ